MELTKEYVDSVRLTKRHRECYDARQVDRALDEIAAAADEQHRELMQLRGMKNQISEVLLIANQTAEKMLAETRNRCNAELGSLQQRKSTLQQEIAKLEQYKALEIERIRNELEKILSSKKDTTTALQHIAEVAK